MPIDYDYLRSTETDNYSQFTKAAFQHRVHEAGGFYAYKEGRYGRMKALRLIARDHRIPDELVSVMLGFLANRTLHDADFSSYSKFCIEYIHDKDFEDSDDSKDSDDSRDSKLCSYRVSLAIEYVQDMAKAVACKYRSKAILG